MSSGQLPLVVGKVLGEIAHVVTIPLLSVEHDQLRKRALHVLRNCVIFSSVLFFSDSLLCDRHHQSSPSWPGNGPAQPQIELQVRNPRAPTLRDGSRQPAPVRVSSFGVSTACIIEVLCGMLMPRIRDRSQEITERPSFTAKADSTLK
jgi:hypothetical protein